jgi:hypothetical protein
MKLCRQRRTVILDDDKIAVLDEWIIAGLASMALFSYLVAFGDFRLMMFFLLLLIFSFAW